MIHAILKFCVREQAIMLILVSAAVVFGWQATQSVPIDAIPDIGDNQVIVYTVWNGRSPQDVEDQITFPLSSALLAVPGSESVRGKSMFGFSFVQVTFNDDIDLYWARSRVMEFLGSIGSKLPPGVNPELGPDASALGQIYYYTLVPTEGMNLADLRSIQDYTVKFALQSVDGVSEVASVGGYVRQYQVEIDPDKLRFHNITLAQINAAINSSNIDVGAKTIESGDMEFIISGKGTLGKNQNPQTVIDDLEKTIVKTRDGIPIRIGNLGTVQLGPEFRRGAIDLNGSEAVGGVVIMRDGENPKQVIQRVKEKIEVLEQSMGGVKILGVYDRTELIDETVHTLTTALTEEIVITFAIIFLFLLHFRASIVVASTLPVAVLIAFLAMKYFHVDANIMSLAGIAIAIGTMVDMGIIVSENIYFHLAEWEAKNPAGGSKFRKRIIVDAAAEVIPAVITAVSTTVISFLPVFFLTGRDYKLFSPLAWTKTFSLVASLIVAVLLVPLLSRMLIRSAKRSWIKTFLATVSLGAVAGAMVQFVWGDWLIATFNKELWQFTVVAVFLGGSMGFFLSREKLIPTDKNFVSRVIFFFYQPTLRFLLKHKTHFLLTMVLFVVLGTGAWIGLPKVMKPAENFAESLGTDPDGLPGYQKLKKRFPGLKSADWIALDEGSWFYMPVLYPGASFSQAMEILQIQDVQIKSIPEVKNVLGKIGRVESALDPAPAAMVETYVMLKPKSEWREGISEQDIWSEINAAGKLPGVTSAAPLQPIEGRVVMLQSGIKASMAVRIVGDDLDSLAKASRDVAQHLQTLDYVKNINPDIVMGKPYVEFDVDRETAARYGMTTKMVNQVIASALGGINVETTVEGRERYPIQVRYQRNFREDIDQLNEIPVVTPQGAIVPLKQLAKMKTVWGPSGISSENAKLVAHVAFAPEKDKLGDLETVEAVYKSLLEARQKPPGDKSRIEIPDGYLIEMVGSFENQIEANERLMWLIPLVITIILLIVYLQFRNLPITLTVFAGIPVAFSGGMIALGIANVELDTAIWVGFIALFGIAIDDGVVMATYLQQVFKRQNIDSIQSIRDSVVQAGLRRIRPCLMTTFTTVIALIPVLISTGRGARIARSMAIPVFGGMLMELITLFVVPVVYCGYREFIWNVGFNQTSDNNPQGDQQVGNLLNEDGDNLTGPQAPLPQTL